MIPWGRLISELERFYRKGSWRVPLLRERGADPFLVLVSTVLSQRTRDEVTERATIRLLSAYPTPERMSRASISRLEALIREVGLSKRKALALHLAAKDIAETHGGRVPLSEADLLKIPMVGPKTAHAVRVFGYRKAGLPVDRHILRVCRRLGVAKGSIIAEVQRELARAVPRRYWGLLNPVLVQHGQNVCRDSRPLCGECPISQWCPRVGV